jgi:hypothetical protein
MSNTLTIHAADAQPRGLVLNHVDSAGREWQSNRQFIAMLDAYRPSGGLARAQEVAAMFKTHGANDAATLANWIIKRQVISFEWQGKIWLPLFQFNPLDMTRQPGLAEALSELVVVYDDWELASWFSLPNPWLQDCTPADSLAAAAPEVLNSARAERYVAAG